MNETKNQKNFSNNGQTSAVVVGTIITSFPTATVNVEARSMTVGEEVHDAFWAEHTLVIHYLAAGNDYNMTTMGMCKMMAWGRENLPEVMAILA